MYGRETEGIPISSSFGPLFDSKRAKKGGHNSWRDKKGDFSNLSIFSFILRHFTVNELNTMLFLNFYTLHPHVIRIFTVVPSRISTSPIKKSFQIFKLSDQKLA